LVRAGVRTLLESGGGVEVVAEADTVDEALQTARDTPLDVVLIDIDEATTDAVDDMRRLRSELSDDAAVVVMARNDDDEGVYRAVVGGAVGHVGENAAPAELVDTIREAASGAEPISKTLAERPAVARRVLETYADMVARGPVATQPQVTDRELMILGHAANGMTNQQIGRALGVSEHTVKSSISQILTRLGLRHRTGAVVHALRHGWITVAQTNKTAAGKADGRSSEF
ncbi:MAG TPA: response regulator transcription factor, partial [Candidatus Limnocylindrales bacterium]|nr:response regulator transcription factor [Candidatus Limnocylindrales bacterium]